MLDFVWLLVCYTKTGHQILTWSQQSCDFLFVCLLLLFFFLLGCAPVIFLCWRASCCSGPANERTHFLLQQIRQISSPAWKWRLNPKVKKDGALLFTRWTENASAVVAWSSLSVTWSGSPPKFAMFCWTHLRATCWSLMPWFPEKLSTTLDAQTFGL